MTASLLFFFLFLVSATAVCHNNCNRHGVCNKFGVCECQNGYEGPDCSLKTCPSAISWSNISPTQDNTHLPSAICSDRGHCDYTTGKCECMTGFIGAACDRLECPNNCSGHGECHTLENYASLFRNEYSQSYSYKNNWDSQKIQGCICDEGYTGYDCSQRLCPYGDDPLINRINLKNGINEEDREEIQLLRCLASQGQFIIYYKQYKTPYLLWSTSEVELQEELRKLPGLEQINVKFSITDSTACVIQGNGQAELNNGNGLSTAQGLGNVISIHFKRVYGEIPPLFTSIDTNMRISGGTVEVNYATDDSVKTWVDAMGIQYRPRKTKKESLLCSGKGKCDYNTGLCQCYQGSGSGFGRGVGYTSSDGYGQPGSVPDCGYIVTVRDSTGQDSLPSCPGDLNGTCSGHGICDTETSKCHCTVGFEGGDCSLRSCPKGLAWFDYPINNEIAHKTLVTCSQMGLCDNLSGECKCHEGFYGNSCQYMRSSPSNLYYNENLYKNSIKKNEKIENLSSNFLRSRFVGENLTEKNNKKNNKKILPCNGHGISINLRQLSKKITREKLIKKNINENIYDDDILISNQGVPSEKYPISNNKKKEITILNDYKSVVYGDDPNNPSTWDSSRIFTCFCDVGYTGYDCSKRLCPSGDDRSTKNDYNEIQFLRCLASPLDSSSSSSDGSFVNSSPGFYLQYGNVRSSLILPSITAEELEKHIDLLLYRYDFFNNNGMGGKPLRWLNDGKILSISKENPWYIYENNRRRDENLEKIYENSLISTISSPDLHDNLFDIDLPTNPSSLTHNEINHSEKNENLNKIPDSLLSLSSLISSSDGFNYHHGKNELRAYKENKPQKRVKVYFIQDLTLELLNSKIFNNKNTNLINKFLNGDIQLPPWFEIDTILGEIKYSSSFSYNLRYSNFFTPPNSLSSSLCSPDGYQFAIIEFTSNSGSLLPLNIINSGLEIDKNLQNSIFTIDSTSLTVTPPSSEYIELLNNSPVLEIFTKGDEIFGFKSLDGTTENQICNNHGLCNYNTGECECFPGWTSSDGRRQGGEGITGDCGYRLDDIRLAQFPIPIQ